MKYTAVVALFALCAIAFAEDAPEELLPCSFRLTLNIAVRNLDGDTIANSRNEIMRDNGNYWVWKSQFDGDEFVQSLVPNHEWVITWRPDVSRVFRQDYTSGVNCYNYTFAQQPLPYDWIQSKTYGIVWYDEIVNYAGKECNLHTAILVGSYSKMDYECEANFYVSRSDGDIVHVNGTFSANKKEINLVFDAVNLFFEHNIPIDRKAFAVNAPCKPVGLPPEPSEEFKKKCYNQGSGSMLTVSWISVLIAMLIALMNF